MRRPSLETATPFIYGTKHRKHWLGGFRIQGETKIKERGRKSGTNTETVRQSKKFRFIIIFKSADF